MTKISRWTALWMVCFFGISMGCNSTPPGPPRTKVTGSVKYKDASVADASVTFQAEGSPEISAGRTDGEGKFSFDAVIGKSKVMITKTDEVNIKVSEEDMKKGNMADKFKQMYDSKPKSHLPSQYGNVIETPLEANVQAGGSNNFDFTLEDKVGPSLKK